MDIQRGKWLYYVKSKPALEEFENPYAHRTDELLTMASEHVSAPIQHLFLAERLAVAAISRWVHVTHGSKKVALGNCLNGVLTFAMSHAAASMNIDPDKVAQELANLARHAAEGRENPDGNAGWLLHCNRALRVSRFFGDPDSKWKIVGILKSVVLVDHLHMKTLGKARMRSTLSQVVDPFDGEVVRVQAALLKHLHEWSNGPALWNILDYVAPPGWARNQTIMRLVRKELLQAKAGIFRRCVLRFKIFPYRFQWLLFPNVPSPLKDVTAKQVYLSHDCCLMI